MADPGYDFFATGPSAAPAEPAAAPTQSRFGGPVEPAPAPQAPQATEPVAAPPAAPAPHAEPAVPVAVPGYHPGAVNRFGTPADLAAVPTGPYAAPGTGAAPIESPGLVSTWSGPTTPAPADPTAYAAPAPAAAYPAPPAPAPAAPAPAAYAPPAPQPAYPAPAPVAVSRFGSPIPPDVLVEDPSYAALAFGTAGAAAYGAPAGPAAHGRPTGEVVGVPGTVKAAGIIGIVEGALSIALALLGLLGYLALKSQVDLLSSSPELAGSGLSTNAILGFMLIGIVLIALIGTGFLVAGIATVKGLRWGAWALLVVSALGVLYGLYEMVSGNGGFGTIVSIAVSGAVVVLLVVKDSMAWLRRS